MRLRNTKAPQLPVAPAEYSPEDRERYSNALRLYFNQIDGDFGALLGTTGDIEGTVSKFDVPGHHGTSDGYLIAACNFYVSLEAGDTVEMWAAVEDTGVYMEAYAAQTSPFAMPSIPSVVATLSFVSNLAS